MLCKTHTCCFVCVHCTTDIATKQSISMPFLVQISALKSTTTSVVSPMANKSKPAAAVAAPPDNDDPFGLSELALALQMAGEPEYWKESLSFSPGKQPPLHLVGAVELRGTDRF